MTHVLVDLEKELSQTLQRQIYCTIIDSEGGGLPLAERYAEADCIYISVLPGHHDHTLADFALEGAWKPVVDDPSEKPSLPDGRMQESSKRPPPIRISASPLAKQNPPVFTLDGFDLRRCPFIVPWFHRRRWPNNELCIRELVKGANLNENYGYTYDQVPNRTRQRQWEKHKPKWRSHNAKWPNSKKRSATCASN